MQETLPFDLLGIVLVVLLVLANGFFVAAEFSLVSVRRTRSAEVVSAGVPSAEARCCPGGGDGWLQNRLHCKIPNAPRWWSPDPLCGLRSFSSRSSGL